MSTFAFDLPAQSGAGHTYAHNLASAARTFLAALLAVAPRRVDGDPSESAAARRARAKDVAMVNRMADQCQSMSPNLAAELRFMASRG